MSFLNLNALSRNYHFDHHSDREAKKVIAWVFKFFATWQFRVVLSGLIDCLQICWYTKCQLEKDLTLDEVGAEIAKLRSKLQGYCQKTSVAAHALAGGRAASGGSSFLEECCEEYRANAGKDLCLQYNLVGEEQQREIWMPIKDLGSPEEVKETFRIIKVGFVEKGHQFPF